MILTHVVFSVLLAFKNYANAAGSKSKLPYLNKVFEERGNLQGFFKQLVLPNTVLNKEVTAIINNYIRGGSVWNQSNQDDFDSFPGVIKYSKSYNFECSSGSI